MSGDVWYLDTSAFLKLVRRERHSAALRRFLAERRVVSSDLLRTEALRAARRQGTSSVERVGELLTRLTLIRCDIPVFEAAGALDPPSCGRWTRCTSRRRGSSATTSPAS